MKKVLLLSLVGISLIRCSSSNTKNSETTTVEEEYMEDEVLTEENILGKWTVVEFDSDLDGSKEMIGKTFEFTVDLLNFTYISDKGLKTISTTYELYSEDMIKVDITTSNGAQIKSKYKGFIQNGKLRLNSSGGSILLKK